MFLFSSNVNLHKLRASKHVQLCSLNRTLSFSITLPCSPSSSGESIVFSQTLAATITHNPYSLNAISYGQFHGYIKVEVKPNHTSMYIIPYRMYFLTTAV